MSPGFTASVFAGMITPAPLRRSAVAQAARVYSPLAEQARGPSGSPLPVQVPAGVFDRTCRRGHGVVHLQRREALCRASRVPAALACRCGEGMSPGIFHRAVVPGFSFAKSEMEIASAAAFSVANKPSEG
jgi:hypothetical protein